MQSPCQCPRHLCLGPRPRLDPSGGRTWRPFATCHSLEAVRAADCAARFTTRPGTTTEVRAIPPLLKDTQEKTLEGKRATESAIYSVKSPRILRLATHGFFLRDEEIPLPETLTTFTWCEPASERGLGGVRELPSLSHSHPLVSGDDGLFTALEVTGMHLYGTDLVVLSACQTALGDVPTGKGSMGYDGPLSWPEPDTWS